MDVVIDLRSWPPVRFSLSFSPRQTSPANTPHYTPLDYIYIYIYTPRRVGIV